MRFRLGLSPQVFPVSAQAGGRAQPVVAPIIGACGYVLQDSPLLREQFCYSLGEQGGQAKWPQLRSAQMDGV